MKPPPVYERAFLDGLDDVVTVRILTVSGQVVGEVIWPENAATGGGDYLYATHVPLALERAEDVRENYGFRAVVIVIDDPSLWDDGWGALVDAGSG